MILDWAEQKQRYVLTVPRQDGAMVQELIREHGFNFFSGSPVHEAVLWTDEPFAAVSFYEYANDRARLELSKIQRQIDNSRATESKAHIRLPPDCELWPFQKCNVEYALSRPNTLVGDQPGLGKTCVAIAVANEIRAKRVLVICPAAIRLQWAAKIREWTTMPWPFVVHTILHGRRGVHPEAQWTVVSYDLASTPAIGKALASYRYDLLILDEAHYCKSSDAIRTRCIFGGGDVRAFPPFAERAARILALSGTPLPNRPREAYTLARGLCHDAIDWMSEDAFRYRFNASLKHSTSKGKVWIEERSARHAELGNRMRNYFMCRHEKRTVLPQLHMPAYDLVRVEKTGPVKAALKAERLLDIDPEHLTGADAAAFGQISIVRRQMGIAMAPQVADYADILIDGGEEKLVIFAWHIEVLNILEAKLRKHGLVRIDGSTSTPQRAQRIKRFIENRECKIILGNILSLGTGTDGLQTVANHCLVSEPDWVPGTNQQAVDRLDRSGQRNRVQADFFVAPGSFAERILAGALRKLKVIDRTLDR